MMATTAKPPSSVLFICTGNYYRSRFAEAYFNEQAERKGLPWRAFSRGFDPDANEGPISSDTREALRERGIPLHRTGPAPVRLTEADLEAATMRIALKEAEHRPMMQATFPEWASRIEYWRVHDLDCATPGETLPHIERLVNKLVEKMA